VTSQPARLFLKIRSFRVLKQKNACQLHGEQPNGPEIRL
jgi:hypothetical protein